MLALSSASFSLAGLSLFAHLPSVRFALVQRFGASMLSSRRPFFPSAKFSPSSSRTRSSSKTKM